METIGQPRVLICHSYTLIAAGIAALLADRDDFSITQVNPRGRGMMTPPDPTYPVVITDYQRGVCMAASRLPSSNAPKVMVVTRHRREWEIRTAIDVGVDGYLYIGCNEREMVASVRALLTGHRYVCSASARRIASGLGHDVPTARELDVLRLLADGFDNKAIAAELSVSVETVKTHVKTVLEKLGAHSRTQAAALALRRGLALDAWKVLANAQACVASSRPRAVNVDA